MNVIDASVAIKLLKSTEDDADRAKKLLHDHLTKATRITVPSLLYLEVANALVTKSIYTQEDIEELLHLLNTFDFVIHSFTKKNLVDAARLAKQYKTSVYDMLYAVIAKEHGCKLITSDEKFCKKTKFPFVQLLDTVV
ncbi:MAG: type II toxin-antitoxin system VapC family toxin [Patescibacteria group bacterium]